jgi:hypothetical protein
MENRFLEKYRKESQVLNPVNNVMNDPFIPSDLNNLRTHLYKIQGVPGQNGNFYDPTNGQSFPGDKAGQKGFVPSKQARLKNQLRELGKEFEKYVRQRVAEGEKPPTAWPPHLEDKKLELEAKIQITSEEIEKLKELITTVEERQKTARPSLISGNPMYWGTGRLQDGQLVEIAGWRVAMDETKGVLCIQDETSPYNGLEVHRFKALVVNPAHMEYRLRHRKEAAEALAQNRPRKTVNFPAVPVYNRQSDTLEFPGDWDPSVIRKIKIET